MEANDDTTGTVSLFQIILRLQVVLFLKIYRCSAKFYFTKLSVYLYGTVPYHSTDILPLTFSVPVHFIQPNSMQLQRTTAFFSQIGETRCIAIRYSTLPYSTGENKFSYETTSNQD